MISSARASSATTCACARSWSALSPSFWISFAESARYLLSLAFTPAEFLALDVERALPGLLKASRHQHGRETLQKLQLLARHSIGQPMGRELVRVERRICDGWLTVIETIEEQMARLTQQLVEAAARGPHFAIVTSLKGISEITAALFLAELRSPAYFRHWKQIEKFAGYNLYVSESGQYRGRRRISHLGGARLRWILYQMVSETSKYVPEIRIKYLERRLDYGGSRNKHLVASTYSSCCSYCGPCCARGAPTRSALRPWWS